MTRSIHSIIPHGIGRMIANGALYEGEFLNGEKHGYGRMIYWNGNYYEGYFEHGELHG